MSWEIPVRRFLYMELMGKHSNIIFCDDKGMILDSIKHVSSHMSSVREVLPGREYFIPKTQDKLDPLTVSEEEFYDVVCRKPCNVSRAVYSSLTGISPVVAEEICFRASIDGSDAAQSLDEAARVLFVSYVPQADGSRLWEGYFLRILFTGGKNLWSMVCLRSSSMDRSIILWSLTVFHRCWRLIMRRRIL